MREEVLKPQTLVKGMCGPTGHSTLIALRNSGSPGPSMP